MSFKLSKGQQKLLWHAIRTVEGKKSTLHGAVEEFNDKLEELFKLLEEKDAAFIDAATSLRSVVDGIVTEWRSKWDDKSERWQKSERGDAANQFIEEWETFAQGLPELALEPPEPLEIEELPDFQDIPAKAVGY